MVSKCANPSCSSIFHHQQGRLFCFPKQPVEDGRPANTHSVQHFWLCQTCFRTHSLEYHRGKGVAIRRHFEEASGSATPQFIAAA